MSCQDTCSKFESLHWHEKVPVPEAFAQFKRELFMVCTILNGYIVEVQIAKVAYINY